MLSSVDLVVSSKYIYYLMSIFEMFFFKGGVFNKNNAAEVPKPDSLQCSAVLVGDFAVNATTAMESIAIAY